MARKSDWTVVTPQEIEAFQRERGISVAELAGLLEVTPPSVYGWIAGRRVPPRKAQERIRAVLDGRTPQQAATTSPPSIDPSAPRPASPQPRTGSHVPVAGRIAAAYLKAHGRRTKPDDVATLVQRVRRALQE